jgi:hypothetical protein
LVRRLLLKIPPVQIIKWWFTITKMTWVSMNLWLIKKLDYQNGCILVYLAYPRFQKTHLNSSKGAVKHGFHTHCLVGTFRDVAAFQIKMDM